MTCGSTRCARGMSDSTPLQAEAQRFRDDFQNLRAAVGAVIVGQQRVVEGVLTAIIAGGNVLLEGVPGLGKTELVKTLARALALELLETMQEGSVTAAGTTHVLTQPFFVLATQNPIEQEGTYPLPEAQLDRFMFKLNVPFPNRDSHFALHVVR